MTRKKKNKPLDLEKNMEPVVSKDLQVIEETIDETPIAFDTKATEEEIENINKELQLARLELETTKKEIEQKKLILKAEDRREISEEERESSRKSVTMSNEMLAKKKALEDQKSFDKVLVTGKFINMRSPGQPVKLPYMKYAEDPVKWYPFEHNKVYTIPRGFADQINDYYHTPRFIKREGPMNPDQPESQIDQVDKSQKKYAFVPVGF
jgi:hypothetical protein